MPHQGHNRLYEISGWENWHRQTGTVARLATIASGADSGTGLTARYYKGRTLMFETTEAPIDFEAFGSERHADRISPHFKAEWSGFIEVPLTDRYRFHTLLGSGEQVAVWIDGRLVHSAGFPDNRSLGTDLVAGHRHRIRVEYINPDGRAELKLLWSSRVMDPISLNIKHLHPDTTAVRRIE